MIILPVVDFSSKVQAGMVGAVTAQSEPDNTESVSVKCLQLFPLSHHFNDS